MLKIIFLPVLCLLVFSAVGQVQTQVVGDSVYIHNNAGTSELILENSTDTVNGFLFNKGAGRTEFRKALIYLGNNKYLIGFDTLDLSGSGSNGSWLTTGNTGTNSANFIGTTDDVPLVFKVNNTLAGKIGIASNDNNVSLGLLSLPTTSSGIKQVAIGYSSLRHNTTGSLNTAVGYSTLYNNLSGTKNVAYGWSAMPYDTSGTGNTAVGYASMNQSNNQVLHKGGSYNTAIGYSSLDLNYNNNYNIGLGYYSGQASTNSNTFYVSDSSYHMYYKLDTASGTAPSVIGKDASGFWHVYQTPSGGSGGGTVTNLATGYGLLGGPITTTGTIEVDSTALHSTFLGLSDSTIYYPFASNPKGYLTSTNAWKTTGNAGTDTTASGNFIGTTDNRRLIFKVNNQISGYIDQINHSTAFGYQALPMASNSIFTHSTAFGFRTFGSELTSSSGGNTGVGAYAGYFTTSGQNNVAIGFQPFYKNTTGSNSIAIGTSALFNNTVSDNNVAVGGGALQASTSGKSNTAVGAYALNASTTGVRNAALGDSAFIKLVTGSHDIGLGWYAGASMSTLYNTLAISDSTYHLYMRLDSVSTAAPNILGKDGNGYWHVYQIPEGVSGGGTVTSVGTGYGLTGGPITTSGTLAIDSALLHQQFLGLADSTIYYPFASNPKGYLSAANAWGTSGNAGTTSSNFIGTTDNVPLQFKVNNTLAGSIGTGSYGNVSYGGLSLPSTTTGNSLVAIGTAALHSNTVGSLNVAVGEEPLYYNRGGSYNTAIGYISQAWDSSGIGNTSIGALSMNQAGGGQHKGGSYNSALGYGALGDNWNNNYNIGIGHDAGLASTKNNTFYISDSTYHMYMRLDSTTGTAPSVIGKDANGSWHVYETPSGSGGGSGTVTNVATGYGLTGGPITTSGTIAVDTVSLHQQFIELADSTTYYPYSSNPHNYLSSTGAFPNHAIPYGNGTNQLTYDSTGLYYDGSNLNAGHSDFYSTTGLSLNGGRGYLGASGFGLTIKTNGGTPEDASKSIWFYNSNNPYLHMSMGSTSDSTLYSENWMTIYPAIDKKFDLGKSNFEWNNLYVHKIIADSIVAGSGGSSGGLNTVQEDGTTLTSRSTLNFNYGVVATDNSGGASTDVNINLSNASNSLSGDVSMSSGTFYNGGSVTLAAGTWMVSGSGTVESGNNSAIKITGKIWDGTTVYTAGENSVGSMGGGNKGYVAMSMNTIITLTSTTTINLSFASNTSGCTLKATPADNNSGTTGKATSVAAVRIR